MESNYVDIRHLYIRVKTFIAVPTIQTYKINKRIPILCLTCLISNKYL